MSRLLCLSLVLLAGACATRAALLPARLGLDLYTPGPATGPIEPGFIRLGYSLFRDTRLSVDGSMSCASCHRPDRAFSDDHAVAIGVHGRRGRRNAPALLNRAWGISFFWDGRTTSLEEQVLHPIDDPNELGSSSTEAARRVGLSRAELAAALASYVRSVRSGYSPVDRFEAGQGGVLSAQAEHGLRVFTRRARCTQCHLRPLFTDELFHNTGVAWDAELGRIRDDGRYGVTGLERDRGAFKTPTLREVARTAPYMHDGSLATLEDVVEFYDAGGRPNPNLDPGLEPLNLTAEEKAALVAFLRSLSGRVTEGGD
jgi:cytochrome c peroxidase